MAKQTAVEYLFNEIINEVGFIHYKYLDVIEQKLKIAKQLEKAQLVEARISSPNLSSLDVNDYIKEAERYYKKTFIEK